MCGRYTLRTSPAEIAEIFSLIRPAPDDLLQFTSVSTLVKNPRNERVKCIQPETADAARDSLFVDE